MRTSQSLVFSIVFLLFTTFTAAWPWPRWLPELESLVPRQDNNDSSEPPSSTPTRGSQSTTTDEDSTITSAPTRTNSEDDETSTSTRLGTSRETGSDRSSGRSSTRTRTTSYDASNPAGGVALVTPAIIDGSQYFKIGDYVTFAWNYTNLLATPSAVNVVASCSANNQVYTIAANQTVANATQNVVWDTQGYMETAQASPLLTEKYTLIIYDAQSSISANAQPGYLAVYNQYQFGMYVKQAYEPLGEWKCATCSGALSDMERKALGMVIGMSVLTVLSFTWFVGGTGVIW